MSTFLFYYFEIEQKDGDKKYGKSKEHRPNPIIQMGLFTDGDGLPLAFSLFPGNQNEQKSLKPLETKILQQFGCEKFIYCSDAGLASEDNRVFNHMGKRSFIVTQSIKKLPAEDRTWRWTGTVSSVCQMMRLWISRNCQKMTKASSITKMNRLQQKTAPTADHHIFPKVCKICK